MSRKRSQPPISLFSFQDIITSVTAIVIVIVLCLTLELLERTSHSAETVDAAAVEALQAAVALLRSQLTEHLSQPASDPSLLAAAAAVTPNQVANEISERERQLADATAMLNRERTRAAELQKEQARVGALRFHARADLEELEHLEDRIRQAEVRLKNLLEIDRPVFMMPRGSRREGWLVVVDGSRIEAARIGVQSPPVKFGSSSVNPGLDTSAALEFLKWADASLVGQRYFMIVVRPGGAVLFQELEEGLTSRSIPYGFDVIAADQALLDPTIGAGSP